MLYLLYHSLRNKQLTRITEAEMDDADHAQDVQAWVRLAEELIWLTGPDRLYASWEMISKLLECAERTWSRSPHLPDGRHLRIRGVPIEEYVNLVAA